MSIFGKKNNAIYSGEIGESIGKISAGSFVTLNLVPDKNVLVINNQIALPYERIVGFKVDDETTLTKSNSCIGRAIIGGMLFGGVGAIVGGMSGKGKTKTTWYGILTYKGKDEAERQIVIKEFRLDGGNGKSIQAMKFENCISDIISHYAEDINEL